MLSDYSQMFFPEDVDKVQAVFDEVLRDQSLSPDSPDAALIAARLIELYKDGVRDAASLRARTLNR